MFSRSGLPFRTDGTHDPKRRLRVGWLSPRFTGGPVASFLGGLLAAFDREQFEHSLVALQRSGEHASQTLRALADHWLDLPDLDDAALLQRLRECSFDIVIDLAGHSTGNRIRVLAQRVAPIQLCWLDYFDTTAVAAIDGWITDAWLTPGGSPQRFSERVLRLPSGRFCYTPPVDAPDPGRIGAGPPVFASFKSSGQTQRRGRRRLGRDPASGSRRAAGTRRRTARRRGRPRTDTRTLR